MRFDERVEGDYRIYAGALDAPHGEGYIAAVVINRVQGMVHGTSPEVWRDDSLAGGLRWASADEALHYALTKGCEVIHRGPAVSAHLPAVNGRRHAPDDPPRVAGLPPTLCTALDGNRPVSRKPPTDALWG